MAIKLVSYTVPGGNVGDDFGPWLFSRALKGALSVHGDTLLFGVGSILSTDFLADAEASMEGVGQRLRVVFGSGARGPQSLPNLSNGDWRFYCVRGPLTARIAGLPCEKAVADPAILAPLLLPATPDASGPEGIVPYFGASDRAWRAVAQYLGWQVISPCQPVEAFIGALLRCSRVWCESMHGAIFADAYGIPWRPISGVGASNEGHTNSFKWTDWSASMGLGFDPLPSLHFYPPDGKLMSLVKERLKVRLMADQLAKASRADRHLLSDRALLRERQDRLSELMDKMSRDLTGKPSSI